MAWPTLARMAARRRAARARAAAAGSRRSLYRRRLRFEPLEDRRVLATLTVTTPLDIVDFDDGLLSLREAIFVANTVPGHDTINFDFGHDGPQTLFLTQGELVITDMLTIQGTGLETIDAQQQSRIFNVTATSGDFTFSGLTLTGGRTFQTGQFGNGGAIRSATTGTLTIDRSIVIGNSVSGLGSIGGAAWASGDIVFTESTIRDNESSIGPRSITTAIVFSSRDLTLDQSAVSENRGIGVVSRKAFLMNSTISGNAGSGIIANSSYFQEESIALRQSVVSGNGGLGVSASSGHISSFGSVVSGNSSTGIRAGGFRSTVALVSSVVNDNDGGGIIASGADSAVVLHSSLVSGNRAGIFTIGDVILHQSTVSNNFAPLAFGPVGGIYALGNVTLAHSTITGNTSESGGGGVWLSGYRDLTINHSIVAGNTSETGNADVRIGAAQPSLTGAVAIEYSLIGSSDGTSLAEAPVGLPDANGNLIGGPVHGVIDPLLGPLADNGGPTMTHALLPGSPAINAGNLNLVAGEAGVPLYDQRGEPFSRIVGGRIDIGAFEYQEPTDLNLLVDTLEDVVDGDYGRGNLSLREALLLANARPGHDTIRFDPALAGGTILLTQGELAITDPVSIIGLGADLLTIDASGSDPTPEIKDGDGSRVFNVDDGWENVVIDVSISGLRLTGGDVSGNGGAIFSVESLYVSDLLVDQNAVFAGIASGGGIYSSGPLVIENSRIVNNLGSGRASRGAGVAALADVAIRNSDISHNQGGGAFASGGEILIADSTFSTNVRIGLEIRNNGGTAHVLRSTISDTAGIGGRGLSIDATNNGVSLVTDSTFARNANGGASATTSTGGMIIFERSEFVDNHSLGNGGALSLISGEFLVRNSIFRDNTAGGDGGAIYAGQNANRTITLHDNLIVANSAAGRGGGVAIFATNGTVAIGQSTIRDNVAASAGGGVSIRADGSRVRVESSTIDANMTQGDGGGIVITAVAHNGEAMLVDASISGNSAGGNGGGIAFDSSATSARAIATQITISGNSALGSGGGVFTGERGVFSITDSVIRDNSTGTDGGGIASRTRLDVHQTTISGNSASRDGGGMALLAVWGGSVSVSSTTLSDNAAGRNGGGLSAHFGGVTLVNATISGNTAGALGGGFWSASLSTLAHSTVTANHAAVAGGGAFEGGYIFLNHTIIAANAAPIGPDLTGFVGADFRPQFSLIGSSLNNGLSEAPVGSPDTHGNLVGGWHSATWINPLLGPLADNGGPTMTHALLPGSPAINAGNLNLVAGDAGVPLYDQRGEPFGRVVGGRIDIGAFEYQTPTDLNLLVDTLEDEVDGDYSRGNLSLREALELANARPGHDTIRFDPALAGGIIVLTEGELAITDHTSIIGLGAERLTIDAQKQSRIFVIDGGGTLTNNYHTDVEIRGLALTGGFSPVGGGAIYNLGNLKVADSVISGNVAYQTFQGRGGGIFSEFAELAVIDSTFTDNYSSVGGAISGWRSKITITGSTFRDNASNAAGAAVYSYAGPVTVTQSIVAANHVGNSGAGIWVGESTLHLRNTEIAGNSTRSGVGGGIYLGNGRLFVWDSTIRNNKAERDGGGVFVVAHEIQVFGTTFEGNSARSLGGGMYASGGVLRLEDSEFVGNSATTGGGIVAILPASIVNTSVRGNSAMNGGGISHAFNPLTVANSTISNNTASDSGGGLFLRGTEALIVQSTISGNSATINGGGVYGISSFRPAFLTIRSSTVTFNSARNAGGVFQGGEALVIDHAIIARNSAFFARDVTGLFGTEFDVAHSVIGDNSFTGLTEAPVGMPDSRGNLIGGATNGQIDPLLAPLADNGGPTWTHALLPGSPAIDMGDPSAVAGEGGVPVHDQRGAPYLRVYGGRIDMGAFEWQPAGVLAGDYNGDRVVDAADYTVWRDRMPASVAPVSSADGNGDGVVDGQDYVVWRSNFGHALANVAAVDVALAASAESAMNAAFESSGVAERPAVRHSVPSDARTFGERQAAAGLVGSTTVPVAVSNRAALLLLARQSSLPPHAEVGAELWRDSVARRQSDSQPAIALFAAFDRAFESLGVTRELY